ncbi:calcium-binding protein [Shinella zoogloeoides]|uniref:calcium-binding protein n=1 Tax=Shinella zoogloeoides TaxID=352475 RepID=UPI0019D0CDCC|nr:cadherin-like domain-containing protein [Shinella zoogloeoides]
MIIDIKATKQTAAQTDPAERYALKSMERKSRTPMVLGLLLAGLVVYLKSFFTSHARPADDAAADPKAQEEAETPPTEEEPLAPVLAIDYGPAEGGFLEDDGGAVLDGPLWSGFLSAGGPQTGARFEIDPRDWIGAKSFGFGSLAANDNMDPGSYYEIPSSGGGQGPDTGGWQPPLTPPGVDGEGGDGDDGEGPDGPDDPDRSNRAPRVSGPVYLMDVTGCAVLAIALSDLLRNAHDPDGDVLSVRNLTISHGTLTPSGGQWLFQGGPKFEGLVTVTYQITDGDLLVDQVAYFRVQRNAIEGTQRDDVIVGTACGDDIDGGAGDDNIDARGGDDVILGGDGDDHIVAGDGDDIVLAGRGDDIVFGGAGNDRISGGEGDDRLYGDDGDDILFGDEGNDLLVGGAGNDILDGGEGDDRLEGGAGNDVLRDGAGRDETFGGAGDDLLVAALDGEDDVHDGGAGHDTLSFAPTTAGVTVDLDEGVAFGSEIGEDTITSFEAVIGGAGNDHIIASTREANVLAGGAGDDIFEFLPPAAPAVAETLPATVRHAILDFDVGDRVRMSKYDLFERIVDRNEDQFEAIYGDDFDDDEIAIRYRHDRTDELSQTVIEADFNRDGTWETTVMIEGTRIFFIIEHA